MGSSPQPSDFKRAFAEDGALKTHIGGQALIEGIMMRGRESWSVAVRRPDGAIHLEEHDLPSSKAPEALRKAPVARGCIAFFESLLLGFRALEIAVTHAYPEEGQGEKGRPEGADASEKAEAPEGEDALGRADELGKAEAANLGGSDAPDAEPAGALGHAGIVGSMAVGLLLGVALFIVAPALVTNLLVGEYAHAPLAWNVVDGLLRIAVFVAYIWLLGRTREAKRMFGYHGAEHKAIHCMEHGLPLTPENARSFPRLHVRCGTAFLIMVMILAIFVYTVTPVAALAQALGIPEGPASLALVIAIRILLMPLIAGIAYEVTVKWAGSHPENPLVKAVLWPGMQMQYLTTREPDDGQIECAIEAMRLVKEREEASAAAAALAF